VKLHLISLAKQAVAAALASAVITAATAACIYKGFTGTHISTLNFSFVHSSLYISKQGPSSG